MHMRVNPVSVIGALAAGLCAAVLALPVPAQQLQGPVPPAPDKSSASPVGPPAPAAGRALTRADLEAWLDGFLPYAMQRGDIAGAVVVVVKDGKPLLQKGYGYADVARRKPVDPARTLFRPGSVSKLFTWTAVMQLAEQGKLDLDRDVNDYLDFKIPPFKGGPHDGQPITMRNLLTHTAGLEEAIECLISTDPSCARSLGDTLKRWTPTRIYAPGGTPAYSNYGAGLAGYIVERVSGQPFDDYIDQHLFAPLGMRHASFRQPLPKSLQPLMSKGYPTASEPPEPYEIVPMAPAGSLAASGADMGRFMLAHLNNGAIGAARILEPQTARQMHTTALTLLPPLNRMLLGFYETNINGRRVIAHGGDTYWFHSDLHLFLDDGIGLFVSMNSAGKEGVSGPIRTALFEQFADRYLPGPAPDGKIDAATAADHARMIAGRYENSRRSQTNFVSLLNLLGQAKVVVNDDGTIAVPDLKGLNGEPIKWREIAPFVWLKVGGKQRLAAKVVDGRVQRFSVDYFSPAMVFEPVPWWRSSAWLLPLLLAGLLALAATAIAWPVSALVRRHYGARYALAGRDARAHRWVRIAAVAVVAVVLAWGITGAAIMSDHSLLAPRLDGWLWVLKLLTLVGFVGAAVIAPWNAFVVLRSGRRWWAKLWSVVLAIACLAVLWVALLYRLIAFGGGY
jgi:CubicO group peptidase (beta-lactamase class C family)